MFFSTEQECIPVGCVPSVAVAIFLGGGVCPGVFVGGCLPDRGGGVCPRGICLGGCTPPCGQTDTCENIFFPQLLLWTATSQFGLAVCNMQERSGNLEGTGKTTIPAVKASLK